MKGVKKNKTKTSISWTVLYRLAFTLVYLLQEIRLIFPNSQRINRGNYEIKQLVDACRASDVTDLILVQEHRGVPDGLVISHLPYGPTAYFTLSNVVMRHDIPDAGTVSEAFPHLIINNFTSPLGRRVNIHHFSLQQNNSKLSRVVTEVMLKY